MPQQERRNRVIIGILSLGLLAGVALTAGPAQAASGPGPYYAEPAWAQSLPAATRFLVLTNWNSAAVLDKETGLVWQLSPSSATFKWDVARSHCTDRKIGNRKGWRLPSIFELQSLIDLSVSPGPKLPPGHPFTNVQAAEYWSASTFAPLPDNAWDLDFDSSAALFSVKGDNQFRAWCVRGGNNAETY